MFTGLDPHRLELIAGQCTEERSSQIVALWVGEGVLSEVQASRRVKEVIYAIVDSEDKVHGVTTAYAGQLHGLPDTVWFLRMFIRKESRKVPGIATKSAIQWAILEETFQFLERDPSQGSLRPQGAVLVTENAKFWSDRWQRALADRGWKPRGSNTSGHRIHLRTFAKPV
ncbi:hypothetical protein HQ447_04550 [bacterium]|nr:hypothetical protein [bacterium]